MNLSSRLSIVRLLTKSKTFVKNVKPSSTCLCKYYSFWFSNNGNGLQKAINNAEKLVGYPTSYSSLKYLVDEEPTNFIGLAKKLVGSGHPLLTTARDLLSQDPYSSHHLGGLWVLLISKASHSGFNLNAENDYIHGIHQKQRALAETTELINTAFLVHRSMVELDNEKYLQDLNKKTLNFGNKLSVLGGDFLLAKASVELAKLTNTEVVKMVSQAIGDMAEGSVIESINPDLIHNVEEWEKFVFLLKGSLMSNSCEAAVVLSDQHKQRRQNAFEFGRNLVLAQQSADDIESFQNKKQLLKQTNIILVLALQRSEALRKNYSLFDEQSSSLSFSREMKQEIEISCPEVVKEVKKMCESFIRECRSNISNFPHKETVDAIYHILSTVHES